jgi:hypothetical protein
LRGDLGDAGVAGSQQPLCVLHPPVGQVLHGRPADEPGEPRRERRSGPSRPRGQSRQSPRRPGCSWSNLSAAPSCGPASALSQPPPPGGRSVMCGFPCDRTVMIWSRRVEEPGAGRARSAACTQAGCSVLSERWRPERSICRSGESMRGRAGWRPDHVMAGPRADSRVPPLTVKSARPKGTPAPWLATRAGPRTKQERERAAGGARKPQRPWSLRQARGDSGGAAGN